MKDDKSIYMVEPDIANNRVIISVYGCFTHETHQPFKADIAKAVIAMARPGKKVDLLFDLTNGVTQPQEIFNDNSWMFALAKYTSRVATAISSQVYKMQLQRLSLSEHIMFFDTVQSAQEWLDQSK